jgi:hypothetical protein
VDKILAVRGTKHDATSTANVHIVGAKEVSEAMTAVDVGATSGDEAVLTEAQQGSGVFQQVGGVDRIIAGSSSSRQEGLGLGSIVKNRTALYDSADTLTRPGTPSSMPPAAYPQISIGTIPQAPLQRPPTLTRQVTTIPSTPSRTKSGGDHIHTPVSTPTKKILKRRLVDPAEGGSGDLEKEKKRKKVPIKHKEVEKVGYVSLSAKSRSSKVVEG